MEFLDIFNKDKDEEVELKPGKQNYEGYSGPGVSDEESESVSTDDKNTDRGEEASLFPGLQGSNDKKDSGVKKNRKSKDLKRIEGKLDKILKQNKMILEKLEKDSGSSEENTVW